MHFSVNQTFTSLRYRNYRLWFSGQTASLVGTWMQSTALGFLVFQLTGSPAYLGLVGFAAGAPTWLFTLYGGVISDRMARRTLLLITQTVMMILAFLLAALTFLGWIQPWQIVVLAFALGIANAFDAPARQAFVIELVDREDLSNAIALNATMFNLATAIGPAVAGMAYALFGPGWCFTINGLSFIAVIIALLMMRLVPIPRKVRTTSTIEDLKEGLRYVISHSVIRILMVVAIMGTLFGLSFNTLLPAWSVTILGGNSATNGFLRSARRGRTDRRPLDRILGTHRLQRQTANPRHLHLSPAALGLVLCALGAALAARDGGGGLWLDARHEHEQRLDPVICDGHAARPV